MSEFWSDQVPHGYYYAPLRDNGPFAQRGQQVGEFVGTVLAQLSATESGPWGEIPEVSMAVEKAGEAAGGMIGNTVGFYMDNAAVILQNLQTLTDQLNDYRSWTTPQPF